jgi:hypothetical protein
VLQYALHPVKIHYTYKRILISKATAMYSSNTVQKIDLKTETRPAASMLSGTGLPCSGWLS